MSKMSDMAMTIEELRNAAVTINEASNWLAEQFGRATEETITARLRLFQSTGSRKINAGFWTYFLVGIQQINAS